METSRLPSPQYESVMQLLVFKMQLAQLRVPPVKKSGFIMRHVLPDALVPSHCSPLPTVVSGNPQRALVGPMHKLVLSMQRLLHLKVPPVKEVLMFWQVTLPAPVGIF